MNHKNYNVVFVHLLNDNSGSPQVLSNTIRSLKEKGTQQKLYIGSDGNGILSLCKIPIEKYWYKRTSFKLLTLFTFLFSQISLFIHLLFDRSISKKAIIFVNTLLPFGAALYGRSTNRKVIYHIHEVSIKPKLLKWLLIFINKRTSSFNIYVSDAHKQALPIINIPSLRIYNSLSPSFMKSAYKSIYKHKRKSLFTILMIASLREYKGIPELFTLANSMIHFEDISFELLVNDDQETINQYCSGNSQPSNLTIHPKTTKTDLFYKRASLVLNLSRIDEWQETFGMTVLESMAYGIPVIVPPIGGPTELVTDNVEGFYIDSRNQQSLHEKVLLLYKQEKLCLSLSKNGRVRAKHFSPENYSVAITSVIKNGHLNEYKA